MPEQDEETFEARRELFSNKVDEDIEIFLQIVEDKERARSTQQKEPSGGEQKR